MHLLFVDPLASTEFLVASLKKEGLQVSALYTVNSLNKGYLSINPNLFDHCLFYDDFQNISELISKITKINVNRIYYGAETGVLLTDQLPNPYANPVSTSSYRYDKYKMQSALKSAGLASIKQIRVIDTITSAQEQEIISWESSYIIKPINSAAAMGVLHCNTIAELKDYLKKQSRKNIFGQNIPYFLIQEYIQGKEYFIDTFSCKNNHIISGIQSYERQYYNSAPICLYTEVISPQSDIAATCKDYIEKVLTVLQLHNGFGHTEIMLTEKGPYLIELNPRISGSYGLNNKLFRYCGMKGQIDLLLDSIHNVTTVPSNNFNYGRKVLLHNYEQRTINQLNENLLQSLPSFKEAHMLKKPGEKLGFSKDLTDTVAFVLLAHQDNTQLLDDYQQIRQWEHAHKLF